MVNVKDGMSFEQYVSELTPEQREVFLKVYSSKALSLASMDILKNNEEKRILLVFSEGYCPDCTATLPFVERIAQASSSIEAYYFHLSGNKELLEEMVGVSRIPTVLCFDGEMQPLGAYIEVPKMLTEKIMRLPAEKQKEYVANYRNGEYDNLVEEELMSILKLV